MSYYYPTANLNADIENREREQYEWLMSRPKCEICKEPIQDEWCWRPICDSNFYICQECADTDDIEVMDDDLEEYHID